MSTMTCACNHAPAMTLRTDHEVVVVFLERLHIAVLGLLVDDVFQSLGIGAGDPRSDHDGVIRQILPDALLL